MKTVWQVNCLNRKNLQLTTSILPLHFPKTSETQSNTPNSTRYWMLRSEAFRHFLCANRTADSLQAGTAEKDLQETKSRAKVMWWYRMALISWAVVSRLAMIGYLSLSQTWSNNPVILEIFHSCRALPTASIPTIMVTYSGASGDWCHTSPPDHRSKNNSSSLSAVTLRLLT